MDNYAAHKHPRSRPGSRRTRGSTSTSPRPPGSWLNLVEVWFGIIERQAIRRGSFPSVRDLMIKIRAFINGWNDRCTPSSGPSPPTKSSTRSNVKRTR